VTDWSSGQLKRHERGLWYGVLAGPLGWLVHLLASYAMAALTCSRGWPGFTLFGWSGGQTIMLIFTLAVEALIASAGWTAYHDWMRFPARPGWRGNGFERWMAFSGVLLSGMFFVAVLFAGFPLVALRPCG
jgi:hypothetical protein